MAQSGLSDLLHDGFIVLVSTDARELAAAHEQLLGLVRLEESSHGVGRLVAERAIGDQHAGQPVVATLSPTHPTT